MPPLPWRERVGVRGKISNISGQDLTENSLGKVRMSIKVNAPTVKEIVGVDEFDAKTVLC